MHQKAIKIKTDLLGPYDYEVGLSIGHLASLYNYQMKKYREAEELYLRSIEISKFCGIKNVSLYDRFCLEKCLPFYANDGHVGIITLITINFQGLRLFGRSYSGLEYDYLGLCHVYEVLREYEKYLKYANMLDNWQILRGQNLTMDVSKAIKLK